MISDFSVQPLCPLRLCGESLFNHRGTEDTEVAQRMPISYAFPLMTELNEQLILDSLRQIRDPDLHKDIVTLGFIKDLVIRNGDVSFRIVLTTPACPVKSEMESAALELVGAIPGVQSVNVTMDAEVPKGRGIGDKVSVPGV